MNNSVPVSLRLLQICPFSPSCRMAREHNSVENFDDREDFIITASTSSIAINMRFCNEKQFSPDRATGVRRRISLSIIDVTDSDMFAFTVFNIYLTKRQMFKAYRVDFPFGYADLDASHEYKAIVRDEQSKTILGEKAIHLFDLTKIRMLPTKWYDVAQGCLVVDDTWADARYLSTEGADYTFQRVRFDLVSQLNGRTSMLPEIELRLYYPDGYIDSSILRPATDKSDSDTDTNRHHVEMRFMLCPRHRGVHYAELRCMTHPIAGFVFNIEGPEIRGSWTKADGELDYIPLYTPYDGISRFERLIKSRLQHGDDTPLSQHVNEQPDTISDSDITDDPFELALNEFISSQSNGDNPDEKKPSPAHCNSTDIASCLEPLDDFTGLDSVKQKLRKYCGMVTFMHHRAMQGLPTFHPPLHAMFMGSPGTGKTTVAKLIGAMLAKAGILSRGHVIVRERATLLGQNYSSESENTLNAIEEAQGGILLIDEAYQLFQPADPRDPGKFVVETLLTAMADENKRDWMLILAGYPERMRKLLDINPGLRSRIPDANIYEFDDFSETQLMEIADRYLTANRYELSDEAREALRRRLSHDYYTRDANFGNARHVMNLIQTDIIPAMAMRLADNTTLNPQTLSLVEATDIPSPKVEPKNARPRVGFTI